MTFKQLEYFLAIAETENMTKAAANLNISQPPLSYQLTALEKELNVSLFKREKKKLIITPQGRLLQCRGNQIREILNKTLSDLQSHSKSSITIRIGSISSVCTQLLPQKLSHFLEYEPDAKFDIIEGSTTSIIDLLAKKSIDFGIIREPFNMNAFNALLIKNKDLDDTKFDSFVAIATPEYFGFRPSESIDLLELKNCPLIVHHRYQELFTNTCRKKGFVPNFFCLNNDVGSSLSWAENGLGIAIVPFTSSLVKESDDLWVKRITHPTISSCAYLIWDLSLRPSLAHQQFINLFRE